MSLVPTRSALLALVTTLALAAPAAAADRWSLFTLGDAPSARTGHSAVLDPVRHRMLVYGGDNTSDVWSLALTGVPAWTKLEVAGTPPPGQYGGQTMVYDSARDRLVMFGGYAGGQLNNDVWALSLVGTPTWSHLAPAGTAPAARSDHSAIYDPVGDRMIVMGGVDMGSCLPQAHVFADLWELRFAPTLQWAPLAASGAAPAARLDHAAVYDPVRHRMVVTSGLIGGFCWCDCGTIYADAWSLSLDGAPVWSQLGPWDYPRYRYAHTLVYDPIADRLITFGGTALNGNLMRADPSALAPATNAETALAPSGPAPSPRMQHAAVFDPDGDRLIVFGGYAEGIGITNQTWELLFDNGTAGVPGPGAATFALGDAWPNPARGGFAVAFRLPDSAPATLALYDLAGREMSREEVGSAGAGAHVWRPAGAERLRPGVYLVKLARGAESRVTRVSVLE